MQIVMNTENEESIYELVYDEESIRNLISDIITNCSIRKQCESCFEIMDRADSVKVNYEITATDWNGNKIHEKVRNINSKPVYGCCGSYILYSFTSDKLLSPKLVEFLIDLLNGKKIDYEWFTSREELSKKQELQLYIQNIDSQINEISNFETKRKIDKLEELAIAVRHFDRISDFDYDLLSKYYDIAQDCIQLKLIQKTFKFQKNLTPKKYLRTTQD